MAMQTWTFDPSLDEKRREALLNPPTFDSLVKQIKEEMKILCGHPQICDDNKGFSRVVYCICIPAPLFDLFFNSENGYRGAYYRSPYQGLESNAVFIQSIEARLIACSEPNCAKLDSSFARESLGTPSAKVWLAERCLQLCEQCRGEWKDQSDERAEILNGRWELASEPNAKRGRKAPYLTKIRIFGAFVNERLDEFVPARKRHRARQIHEFGWS